MRRYIILAGFILMGIKPAFSQSISVGFIATELYRHDEKTEPIFIKGIDVSYIHHFNKIDIGIGYSEMGEQCYKLSFSNNMKKFIAGMSILYFNRGFEKNILPKKFGGEINLGYNFNIKNSLSTTPKLNLGFSTEHIFFSMGLSFKYKIL